jgi:hypothetical protein
MLKLHDNTSILSLNSVPDTQNNVNSMQVIYKKSKIK